MQEEEDLLNCSLAINDLHEQVNCAASFHILFTEASETAIFILNNIGKRNPIRFAEEEELENQRTSLVTIKDNKMFSMHRDAPDKLAHQ